MARIDEIVSDQFRAWEERGRGWKIYPSPVGLEPPFRQFTEYHLPRMEDDGRKETLLSSLFDSVRSAFVVEPPQDDPVPEEEPEPREFEREIVSELQILLPADLKISEDHFKSFLDSLESCREPVAFELIGEHAGITALFAGHPTDTRTIERRLAALFPNATFVETEGRLESILTRGAECLTAVDFGLEDEFILPLSIDHSVDPFVGITSAMNHLAKGETALFQVLFEPAVRPWPASAMRAITDAEGKSIFFDFGQLLTGAKEKFKSRLFAAVVRVSAAAGDADRAWEITRDLAFSLRPFSNPEGNGLIPLHNHEYPIDEHVSDMLRRQSRRTGMLLNRDELLGFVHLPSDQIQCAKLKRQVERTKLAPTSTVVTGGTVLGENRHVGKTLIVALSPSERTRHMHVIGASGTGKSTLLFNLITRDIENGEGIAVLEPHGDLIDRLLGVIPPERMHDVVLIDPADEEYSVGFNFLSAHSDLEKNLLASDLVSIFHRLSASWGDQMGSVLQNAILAFLESSRGGTISDLRRFLIERAFREEFLCTVSDPDIVYYWRKGFEQLSGNKSIGPVITRLDTFLAPKPIRYMVTQEANKIDFANILNTGKIFLAKLSQGQIGRENSFLLGSLLVAKFQQLAMGRQNQAAETRRPFYLYIDEFQNFITPSMAEILSGARKYKLGLILAHQELRQLERDREVASAVLSNSYTRIVFRVGDADARALESGFSYFEARDLQNLETGQAICRIEKASNDFNLSIPFDERQLDESIRNAVVEQSRRRYGTPRRDIEAAFLRKTPSAGATEHKIVPNETEKRSDTRRDDGIPKDRATGPRTSVEEHPELSDAARAILPKADEICAPASEQSNAELRDKGKGGARHKIIQKRIKEAAEVMGFDATIEKQISNSQQTIDVFLERSDLTIACETSFETTTDHEIGNVSKCFNAGAGIIAIICLDQVRLGKIRKSVLGTFSVEQSARVQYFEPAEFIAYLKTIKRPEEKHTKTTTFKGRTVKRTVAEISPEERAAREDEYHRQIAEGLKRKKTKTK